MPASDVLTSGEEYKKIVGSHDIWHSENLYNTFYPNYTYITIKRRMALEIRSIEGVTHKRCEYISEMPCIAYRNTLDLQANWGNGINKG